MKANEIFKKLMEQPENPNIPKPIFLVVLALAIIGAGGYQLSQSSQNSSKPNVEISADNGSEKGIFDKILEKFKKEEGVSIQPFNPPPIPEINKPQIMDNNSQLVADIETLGDKKYEIKPISLDSVGRKDPMKPTSVLTTYPIEVYKAKLDEDLFYPISYEYEGEEKTLGTSDNVKKETKKEESDNKETVENIIEVPYQTYISYQDAINDGKQPSKEAKEYYNEHNINIEDYRVEKFNDSVDYFEGLTIDKLFLDNIELTELGVPQATFLALGGKYVNVVEGDFINTNFYVKDLDIKNQVAEIEFKYGSMKEKKETSLKAVNLLKTLE